MRPPWKKRDGDNWIEVASLEEACDAIPPDARVLLALGSQHIAPSRSVRTCISSSA
jgi:precorrin-6A/cobalt-precorrin-6A reductase